MSPCGDFQVLLQGRSPSSPQKGFWGGGRAADGEVGGQGNLLLTSGYHLFPTWGSAQFHLKKDLQKGGETVSRVELSVSF